MNKTKKEWIKMLNIRDKLHKLNDGGKIKHTAEQIILETCHE